MSELVEKLRVEFQDEEYRHAYADECLNTMIATQIKVLREQRGMTQGQLAEATGMKQPRIPLLEDASYSNWTINTLKRFAKAFDVALSVSFEAFSHVIGDFEALSRQSLQRPTFADDQEFHRPIRTHRRRFRKAKHRRNRRSYGNWKAQSTNAIAQAPVSDANSLLGRKPPKSEVREWKQEGQDAGGGDSGLIAEAGRIGG
jgi:transcriptional regulator with XRE-family HTH domain